MEQVLGTSFPVFIFMVVIVAGGASFLMGNAIAETWRPWWQNIAYGVLLAFAAQFLTFSLFDGAFIIESLVSSEGAPFGEALTAYLVNLVVLTGIALTAYRLTLSQKMVRQYPWLYERTGPFGWRSKV
jgi:branched-chain amino acid transport system ATP-binding protein